MSVKGHWRRPCCTGKEEADLRAALLAGDITKLRFNKKFKMLLLTGGIIRDGRVIQPVYDKKCPECQGEGLVTTWFGSYRDRTSSREACPECGGTGGVLACPTV